MNLLIPIRDDSGLFSSKNGEVLADSRYVAEKFGKQHKHVLRDIENILNAKEDGPNLGCHTQSNDTEICPDLVRLNSGQTEASIDAEPFGLSEEFKQNNFKKASYRNDQNKRQPCYHLTRDGFMLLIFGYQGGRAMAIKEWYITKFNQMERLIADLLSAKKDFKRLTNEIKQSVDDPKSYIYSNECNMINKLVTGKSTADYRRENNIPNGESIRCHLTPGQIALLDDLEIADSVMLSMGMSYQERKERLTALLSTRYAGFDIASVA